MTEIEVQKYIAERGLRPSVHRIAVMKYLLDNFNHPTVDDIYNGIHDNIPTLSKTTIYNILKLFAEKKAIISLNIEEKNVRYDGHTHPHSHFKCIKCGKIFDLPLDENINFANCNHGDFKIEDTQVYYKGLCPECNKITDKKDE